MLEGTSRYDSERPSHREFFGGIREAPVGLGGGGCGEATPPPTLYKGRTSIGHKIYLLLPFRTMHGGCKVGALTSFVGASRGGDALVYANPS